MQNAHSGVELMIPCAACFQCGGMTPAQSHLCCDSQEEEQLPRSISGVCPKPQDVLLYGIIVIYYFRNYLKRPAQVI